MEELKFIIPYCMTTVILVIITVIIFRLFNFILQKRIIDSGPVDEYAIKFLKDTSTPEVESLKWGILFLFGGIGLTVLQYLPVNSDQLLLSFGIEAVFLGAGFLTYYRISRKGKI